MGVNMGAVSGAAAGRGFQRTFNFLQDAIRQNKEAQHLESQRAIAEEQSKATAKVSEMMAGGPGMTAIPSDTQQSAQLASQTDDADPDLDLTTGDDVFDALEEDNYAKTGRTKIMAKDWDRFEQEFGQSLGAINDPDMVAALKDYPNALRQRGFASRIDKAALLLEAGDIQGAQDSLETAMSYMNDGTVLRTSITKDKDGNDVIVSNSVDEETGEPIGNPVVYNKELLSGMARRAKKGADTWDDAMEQRDMRVKEAKEITAAQKAAGGAGGKWNDANAARVGREAQTLIDSLLLKTVDDDLANAYANNEAEFISMVTQIGNSTQNMNVGGIVTMVKPVVEARGRAQEAGTPAPTLVHDPAYGYFVKWPEGVRPPENYDDWMAGGSQ